MIKDWLTCDCYHWPLDKRKQNNKICSFLFGIEKAFELHWKDCWAKWKCQVLGWHLAAHKDLLSIIETYLHLHWSLIVHSFYEHGSVRLELIHLYLGFQVTHHLERFLFLANTRFCPRSTGLCSSSCPSCAAWPKRLGLWPPGTRRSTTPLTWTRSPQVRANGRF